MWPCKNCTAPGTCTSCSFSVSGPNTGKTMLLYDGFCYDTCPERTMKNGIICEDCRIDCLTCAVTTDTCTSCDPDKKLYNA